MGALSPSDRPGLGHADKQPLLGRWDPRSLPSPSQLGGPRQASTHGPWGTGRRYGRSHLELPPGVKLFQALHGLLSVHHGSHRGALLWGEGLSHPARSRTTQLCPQGKLEGSGAGSGQQGLRTQKPTSRSQAPGHAASRTPGHPSGVRGGARASPPGGVGVRATYADPRVLQCLVCRDALGGVDGEHLVDEVLGFRCHGVPLGGWELKRSQGTTDSEASIPRGVPSQPCPGKQASGSGGPSTHVVGPSLDLLVQLMLVLVPEGRVPHEQDVQDHPWGSQGHRLTPLPPRAAGLFLRGPQVQPHASAGDTIRRCQVCGPRGQMSSCSCEALTQGRGSG